MIPINLSRNGPKISHLFFADDVLLFTKANVTQATLVRKILDTFCEMSGLKISMRKSKLYASLGVQRFRRLRLTQVTDTMFTTSFDKYLGFKFIHGRSTKNELKAILTSISLVARNVYKFNFVESDSMTVVNLV